MWKWADVYAAMWMRAVVGVIGLISLVAAASDDVVDGTAQAVKQLSATAQIQALWSEYVVPQLPQQPSLSLLDQGDDVRYYTRVAMVVLGYIGMYVGPAAFFELTNPKPKTPARLASIRRELNLGILAMLVNTGFAVFWMTVVEPYTPFYGFFHPDSEGRKSVFGFSFGHEHNSLWLVAGLVVYALAFDWWFWWTHILLHFPWFFKNVHSVHHNFVNPTAFGQDAVHPFEGVLQGPMGHYFASLCFPMHPVAHAVFGFVTSVYAIAAHDGRAYDLADHTVHHHHKELNFGLYGCFDCLCGTRYRPGYNPSVRGLAMNRYLQFEDVYTRTDLAKGLAGMRGTPAMAALREEVAACRAREGGTAAAVAEADADVQAGDGADEEEDVAPVEEDSSVQPTSGLLSDQDVDEEDEEEEEEEEEEDRSQVVSRRRRSSTSRKGSVTL